MGPRVVYDLAPNTEPDLSGYRLYRGSNPNFPIDEAHLLATVTDTTMTDGGWDQALGFHYKVAAVDIHDNIGRPPCCCPMVCPESMIRFGL